MKLGAHGFAAWLLACTILPWPLTAAALQPVSQVGWRLEVNGTAADAELTLVTDFPVADQGRSAQQFLAASVQGELYCYAGSSLGWVPCGATIPAHAQGGLPAQARLVLGRVDTVALRGTQVYAGYGESAAEMLAAGRYRLVATLGPARGVEWSETQTLPGSANAAFAFNNTGVALHDATGVLHLVWADGTNGFHARLEGAAWSVSTLPKSGTGSFDKPTIALLADGELMLAWSEFQAGERRLLASRSRDGRARWESALTLASGKLYSSVALAPVMAAGGVAGAAVAWIDESAGRVLSRHWRGTGWSLGHWSTALSPAASTAVPNDVALAGHGSTLWAAWEDRRGGGSATEVYLARSDDGGLSWAADQRLPVAGSAGGGDPSLRVLPDGDVLLGYQHQGRSYRTLSSDGGASFAPPTQIGPGLFVHVAANERGTVAFTWEHFTGAVQDDAGKTVGHMLSLDGLATLSGTHAMPGSEAVKAATMAAATVSQQHVDVFWIDASADSGRPVRWRRGRLLD